MENKAAILAVYVLTLLMIFVYVDRKFESHQVGTKHYKFAGFMQQDDGTIKLYVPFYKEEK